MRATALLAAGVCVAACALLSVFVVATTRPEVPLIPRLEPPALVAGWSVLAIGLLAALASVARERLRRRARPAGPRERALSLWPLLLASAAAAVVTLVVGAFFLSMLRVPEDKPVGLPPPAVQEESEEPPPPAPPEASPRYLDPRTVGLLLLVFALSATALLLGVFVSRLRGRRRGAPWQEELSRAGLRREIARGLRVSLEEILADRDCRRAIIACYARMEQGFAAAGLPRSVSEAPLEYLGRVVAGAGVSPSVSPSLGTLTRLYEIARFSEHAMSPADREDAIGALRELERELTRESATEGTRQ